MDADRYITDEAVQAAYEAYLNFGGTWVPAVRSALAAALPHIEPLIRADVLRELALMTGDEQWQRWLHAMADEAVAQ